MSRVIKNPICRRSVHKFNNFSASYYLWKNGFNRGTSHTSAWETRKVWRIIPKHLFCSARSSTVGQTMQAFSDFYFDRITDQTTVLLDKPSNFTGRAAKVFLQLLFRHISSSLGLLVRQGLAPFCWASGERIFWNQSCQIRCCFYGALTRVWSYRSCD